MKKATKLLALLLAMLMMLCIFTGCESEKQKIEKLAGTWTMVKADPEDEALYLLENIDFYEEEIELIDLTTLDSVYLVEFTTEKTYLFAYDADATKECVREFYVNVFDVLYENRNKLSETYGKDFGAMTEDEFFLFYAGLYGIESYEAMIDRFTETAYDYESLAEPFETGTFTIKGQKILCTITGETQAESLGYAIEGNTLTLTYSDGVEVYTR